MPDIEPYRREWGRTPYATRGVVRPCPASWTAASAAAGEAGVIHGHDQARVRREEDDLEDHVQLQIGRATLTAKMPRLDRRGQCTMGCRRGRRVEALMDEVLVGVSDSAAEPDARSGENRMQLGVEGSIVNRADVVDLNLALALDGHVLPGAFVEDGERERVGERLMLRDHLQTGRRRAGGILELRGGMVAGRDQTGHHRDGIDSVHGTILRL